MKNQNDNQVEQYVQDELERIRKQVQEINDLYYRAQELIYRYELNNYRRPEMIIMHPATVNKMQRAFYHDPTLKKMLGLRLIPSYNVEENEIICAR